MVGAALLASLLVGCGSAKSDFDTVCNSEARVGATGNTPADYTKAMTWAAENVKTDEVKKFMASLATIDPSSKAGALRHEAAKAGVSPCQLADSWERGAKQPVAP